MMTKVKNAPFWTACNAAPKQYPWLGTDEECEVCVVGGGITGAMTAYRFASEGIDTVLVNDEPVGFGATAVAVPYATYDMGLKMTELTQKFGIPKAIDIFTEGAKALDMLERIVDELDEDIELVRRDSLIIAEYEQEADVLNKEYLMRRHNGFDVEYISKETARNLFSFDVEGAILSRNGALNFDPYMLTHAIMRGAVKKGARVYENTAVSSIVNDPDECVLYCSTGRCVTADSIVMAVGHESKDFMKGAVQKRTSFAVVTEQVNDFSSWPGRCVISTWSKPEIIFSTTLDDRIFVNGLSTGVIDKDGRMFGKLPVGKIIRGKLDDLNKAVIDMFPKICAKTEFEIVGNYPQTSDSLPIFGEINGKSGCQFAVCTGVNSILFSEMAGRFLLSEYGCDGNCCSIFSPSRFNL